MDKWVAVFMKAYRDEPEVKRAVQSVLNQTYRRVKLYVLVNEETEPSLRRYTQNAENVYIIKGLPGEGFFRHMKEIAGDGNDYVMTLDADDYYNADAIENMLFFSEENGLDIVAGGYAFVDEKGEIIEERKCKENMIWKVEQTSVYLHEMYGLFRTLWGKLFSANVVLKCDCEKIPPLETYGGYGGDTLLTFDFLNTAEKVGIMNCQVYHYTISTKGATHDFQTGRIKSDATLFMFVKDFLEEKSVYTEENSQFLFAVYGNAILDTIRLIRESTISADKKREYCREVLGHSLTKLLLIRNELGMLKKYESEDFTKQCIYEVFERDNIFIDENDTAHGFQLYTMLTEAMQIRLDLNEYLFLSKVTGGVFAFHYGDRKTLMINYCRIFINDIGMKNRILLLGLMKKIDYHPLLHLFLDKLNFALKYKEIMELIVYGRLQEAMDRVRTAVLTHAETEYAEELIELWSDFAAFLEDAAEYIFVSEVFVEYLVQNGKKEEAAVKYRELLEMDVKDENMEYLRGLI